MAQLARHLLLLALGTVGMSVLLAGTVFIPVTMIVVGATHLDDCPAEQIPFFLLVGGSVWFIRNMINLFSKCSSATSANGTLNRTQRHSTAATRSTGSATAARATGNACTFDCELAAHELQSSDHEQEASNTLTFERVCSHRPSTEPGVSPCMLTTTTSSANHSILLPSRTTRTAAVDRPTHAARRRLAMLHTFWLIWFVGGCVMVYRIFPPEYQDKNKTNYCDQSVYLFAFWLVTSVFIIFGLFVSCLCCVSIAALFSSPAARQRLSSGP
jgi:hypothetical protein